MQLPEPRGPVSAELTDLLAGLPGADPAAQSELLSLVAKTVTLTDDILSDDDLQLALFCLYELHYGGLEGVDDAWEWEPGLIAVRRLLEGPFEQALRSAALEAAVPAPATSERVAAEGKPDSDAVADMLFALAAQDGGPSLSRYVAKKATVEQLAEFLIHKSVYQLKEADPHTWAIPRLAGRPRPLWWKFRRTSTGADARTGCIARCSPGPWTDWGSIPATAVTRTSFRP